MLTKIDNDFWVDPQEVVSLTEAEDRNDHKVTLVHLRGGAIVVHHPEHSASQDRSDIERIGREVNLSIDSFGDAVVAPEEDQDLTVTDEGQAKLDDLAARHYKQGWEAGKQDAQREQAFAQRMSRSGDGKKASRKNVHYRVDSITNRMPMSNYALAVKFLESLGWEISDAE